MKINSLGSIKLLITRKFFLFLLLLPVLCVAQKADEYQVKSAYLEKVTRFISWPADKHLAKKDTFVIGVVGKNPFGNTLHSYFKNQTIKEKQVKIIIVNSTDDIEKCDLLFISKSASYKLEEYIKKAYKHNVLTVGDTKGFAEQGVHVNLPVQDVRVKLEIGYDCIKNAGFKVESILLTYATVIECDIILGGEE